jgi:hypothetical protein
MSLQPQPLDSGDFMNTDTIFDANTAPVDFTLPEITSTELSELANEFTEAVTDSSPEQNAPKKQPRRDPYTISEDGHIVGHDGFVVPRDFREFYERFPRYVRGFVRRRWLRASEAECEDRESELLIHLMTLPEDSKFRAAGFNGLEEGCQDRIQIFHPDSAYGASAPRFFSYINLCLLNHFCSLTKKASSNPIRRYNTLSLYSPDGEGEMVDDDYIYSMASQAYYNGCNYDRLLEDGMLINEFVSFVESHNPELVSVIEAIAQTETFVEAQKMLGLTEKLFLRARNRLGVLHTCFNSGEVPPRQRKVYRSRQKLELSSSMSLGGLLAEVV